MVISSKSTSIYEQIRKRTIFLTKGKTRNVNKPSRDRFHTAVFLPSWIVWLRNWIKDETPKMIAQIYQKPLRRLFELASHYCKIFINLEKLSKAQESYNYIKENKIGSTLPKVEVDFRIFFRLPTTKLHGMWEELFSSQKNQDWQ